MGWSIHYISIPVQLLRPCDSQLLFSVLASNPMIFHEGRDLDENLYKYAVKAWIKHYSSQKQVCDILV